MTHRSPLLDLPGAVAADEPDVGVAAHYGDPMREQRRLAAGQAVVDLSHRGVVRVAGPDRLTWLHSLLTQHLTDLQPDTSTQALLLSPNGHVEHHLRVTDDGDALWATVEPGTAPALVEFLRSMQFLMRVEVVDVSADWAVVWSAAGEARVPRAALSQRVAAAESVAGVWAYEALRIARGEPRLGLDTDARTIPNEVGWLDSAVHLDKGCYRGQETVAKVHTIGRPPRRLTLLHLDGSVERLPSHGDQVLLPGSGKKVGVVGSAARHFTDGPIGLALLKRSAPTDATLHVVCGDVTVAAAQEPVVDPEIGLHARPHLG